MLNITVSLTPAEVTMLLDAVSRMEADDIWDTYNQKQSDALESASAKLAAGFRTKTRTPLTHLIESYGNHKFDQGHSSGILETCYDEEDFINMHGPEIDKAKKNAESTLRRIKKHLGG
jgi:hypothetical protein